MRVDTPFRYLPTPHQQYGLLTLVNQESHVAALQVKNADGQWITAHPIPGAFVCNIGDMLRVLTNDRYLPTAHRVINADPEQDRVSIPFFYEPSFDAEVCAFACGGYQARALILTHRADCTHSAAPAARGGARACAHGVWAPLGTQSTEQL